MARVTKRLALDLLLAIGVVATAARFAEPWTWFRTDPPPLVVGALVDLPGVQWTETLRTIVLFLEPNCPACNQSLPFYQSLLAAATPLSTPVVVVSSRATADEVMQWLTASEVHVSQVVRVPESVAAGLFMTPTLILLDHARRITDIVHGVLVGSQAEHVLARVRYASTVPLVVSAQEVPARLCETLLDLSPTLLIDVRRPDDFRVAHHERAINVPLVDFALWARNDVRPGHRLLLAPDAEAPARRFAAVTLMQEGWSDVHVCSP